MQGRQKSFHIGRGHGMLKNYYGPRYYCLIFAFQCLFLLLLLFLVFFAGFVVKTRIGSHPFSKQFILSQRWRSSWFFLNYLKRLSFCQHLLYKVWSTYIFCEDFIKNTIYFTHHLNGFMGFLYSYRIWAYLREINIKKFWYTFEELRIDRST